MDAKVYEKPYATKFDTTGTGSFPTILGESGLGQTKYFQHEIGTDQVNEDGTVTTIASNIKSYDYDLQDQGGGGNKFVSVSRFIPDFKNLDGNANVTLSVKRFPSQTETSSTNSPFTITSSTTKKDTRARGRYVSVKIENTAINESWRYGTLMLDVKPDGGR
jgi:hypothetical protein